MAVSRRSVEGYGDFSATAVYAQRPPRRLEVFIGATTAARGRCHNFFARRAANPLALQRLRDWILPLVRRQQKSFILNHIDIKIVVVLIIEAGTNGGYPYFFNLFQ
jgi:hypothetical protein